MCKWYKDEFCTNDRCPYCADYCPVAQDDKICKYRESDVTTATDEEREQRIKRYIGGLPKGTQEDIWEYINSLKERIEDCQAVKIHTLQMQNGVIDMSVEGEQCKAFMAAIIQIFEQNGAKNFFTTTVELDDRKGSRYALTIQKMGSETPAEQLSRIRKETAKEILDLIKKHKFNIGKALYQQSIDDDCDAVSADTLELVITQKYGVEAKDE